MKYRDIILLISASAALMVKGGSTCQSKPSNTTKVPSKISKYDFIPNFHRVELGAPLQAN